MALAAVEAGIDRGTAYNWRRRDADFAAAWDAALARARAALADAAAPLRLGAGQAVWGGARQPPRATRIKDPATRWDGEAERRFLDKLAADANVSAACAVAGFSNTAVYARRRRSAAFRARWDAALEEGWARLAAKLMRQAANGVVRGEGGAPARIAEPDEDRAIEDPALAANLLKQHEAVAARVRAGAAAGAAARAPAAESPIEAVRDTVLAGVRGVKRGMAAAEGRAED